MNNSWKVAKWEIKRNLKNKSFLLSMFLTPVIFLAFFAVGYFFGWGNTSSADRDNDPYTLHIIDEAGVGEQWQAIIAEHGLPVELVVYHEPEEHLRQSVQEKEVSVYTVITPQALEEQHFVLVSEDGKPDMTEARILHSSLDILTFFLLYSK